MTVTLLTVRGTVAKTVQLPDLQERLPEVIVWTGRYFVLDKRDGTYREGMVYFTDRQGL